MFTVPTCGGLLTVWKQSPFIPPGMKGTDVFPDSLLTPLDADKHIHSQSLPQTTDRVLQLLIIFMSNKNKQVNWYSKPIFFVYIKQIFGYKFDCKNCFKTIVIQCLETIPSGSLMFCSLASRGTDNLCSGQSNNVCITNSHGRQR